ncbi:MAG: CaiB/BaiF CoA transferase family protein [Acidimicrobiia bacterium]
MEASEFYEPVPTPGPGPLAGIRVLEATTSWAGPMCGCVLADLGADVVKVELAGGEVARKVPPFLPGSDPPLSFMHATVNRNKRSVCLDLRTEAGREVFLDLARRSDVVLENFCAGTLDGWGLGYRGVRAVKDDIVYCSISGFGQWGPDHDRVAYDPLIQATAGFMSVNGEVGGEPVKAPTYLTDDISGLHGAVAILAALRHRSTTGEGQHLDVSMLDALLFQSSGHLTLGAIGADRRWGNEFSVAAPANAYECKDGRVFFGVLLDTQWKAMAQVIGGDELAANTDYHTTLGRIARRDELNALLGAWAAKRTKDEICDAMRAVAVPAAAVRTYAEAAADPHILARGMLVDVVQPDGSTQPITGPAAKFSRTPTSIRSAAPTGGAHTDEVLAEIGYQPDRIERLRAEGVL